MIDASHCSGSRLVLYPNCSSISPEVQCLQTLLLCTERYQRRSNDGTIYTCRLGVIMKPLTLSFEYEVPIETEDKRNRRFVDLKAFVYGCEV